MYEVWFENGCGHAFVVETFDTYEEASAYLDEQWETLEYDDWMEIYEKKED